MDELTGERLGKYRLLDVIGQGGMSTVYRAVDEVEDSFVAVKLLSSYVAQEPRFRIRFNREIEVLKSLTGGKIVPILDYGEQEAFTYIVMPYLSQGTLQDRLNNGGITLRESGEIVKDVSAALQLAHDRGVVHRDVKPSNILLDETGGAYLSDFGFAFVSESSHSLTGSVLIGTPAFMSPEQCRGDSIDERSDQYSLGAVLFQLTTGRLPYEAETPMGMVVKHIHDPLPRPRSFNPYLPDAVESVIQRAMAKSPEGRFESIKAFNHAYQRALRRSLDPDTGLPKPDAVGEVPVTAVMPGAAPLQDTTTPLWAKGRTALAVALVAMLAIPLAAWALTGRTPGAGSDLDLPTPTLSADLLATIQALSTENADILGAAVGPEQIQTAVAATVQAMAAAAQPSATPSPTELSAASPTPTGVFVPVQTNSPGSGGGSGGGGDSEPAPTSTPVPPTAAPTGAPTAAPTNPPPATSPPPDTPIPPPTQQGGSDPCNEKNPNKHCTPTP